MRVAVVGCGSLGGVIAVRMAGRPGLSLEVLNRNPLIAEAAARSGLRLKAGGRWTTARVTMGREPPAGGSPYDAVVLAQKANGLERTCRELLPALSRRGFFVTTQNGLVALDLARALGPERVIPGSVLWGASMLEPGVYELTAGGAIQLGELGGAQRQLDEARSLLRAVCPVRLTGNITGTLWSKLAITVSFTSLGALSGLRFGELARRPSTRRLLLAIAGELPAAAAAEGVRLEPLAGGLDVRRFLLPPAEGGYPPAVKHLLLRLLGWKHRRTESAMLDSLRRGRPTEIDFLNGALVRAAARAGLPAPWNRAVCEVVARMESGRLPPQESNLALLRERAAELQAGSRGGAGGEGGGREDGGRAG
jgi:2-dehydropantoate 2-reductase